VADRLALFLRIFDSLQRFEKALLRIHRDQLQPQVRAEGPLHLLTLVESQQPGIDEDASELIANGAVHERRGDRRVYAP
jgi:hypothetical protein